MKPVLTSEQQDALEAIQKDSDSKQALRILGEAILSEKFGRRVLEASTEQLSDLGIRQLAYKRTLHEGAENFLRCLLAEISPKQGKEKSD